MIFYFITVAKSVGFQPYLWTKISKCASSCRGTIKQGSDPLNAQSACPRQFIHSVISPSMTVYVH